MRLCAIVVLTAVAAIGESTDAAEWFRRATAAHERGDLVAAILNYQEALKRRPDWTAARSNLGSALAQSGRTNEAIVAFESVIRQNPKDVAARQNLAQALLQSGRASEAAKELERLLEPRPKDSRIIKLLAECYLSQGNYGALLDLVEPASRALPADSDLSYLTGVAMIRNGHAEEGLLALERATKQKEHVEALVLAGATALNLGQSARAAKYLDRAVVADPKLPVALTWAGIAHDRVGDEDGAKDLFQRALALNKDDFDANFHYGTVLYRQRELATARPYLERAVALQPSSSMARYALALIKSGTGSVEEAISDLERIVAENPVWVEPRAKLASLYFRTGRTTDGQKQREEIDKLIAEKRDQHASFEQ